MEIVVSIAVSLLVGIFFGVFFSRLRKGNADTQLQIMDDHLKQQQAELLQKKAEVNQLLEVKNGLTTQVAVLQADVDRVKALRSEDVEKFEQRYAYAKEEWQEGKRVALEDKDHTCQEMLKAMEQRHREAIEAQQIRFDEILKNANVQLQAATEELLKRRQKEFEASSHTNLGQIVNPLKDTIERMKETMADSTLKQTEMSSVLKANIEHMMRQSEAARQSSDELTRVFKHGSKVQGDWGETVLDEILESQGLTKGIHYETQPVLRDAKGNVIRTEEGNMMRPDVILHLDTRREVIIDSKVSLTAFIDYVNAENEEDRQRYLKLHIESLQKHVKELSVKDYSSYIVSPKVRMDYVIMFVPHVGALWTALNAQPDLWRRAMEKNVFIADEQTLFAALRIINLTWTQIAQAQNHEKVFALANEMLDRVGQFMKRYEAIGGALKTAQTAYEMGWKKLQPTGQSIIGTCKKMEKLGAKDSDKNPLRDFMDVEDIPALPDE